LSFDYDLMMMLHSGHCRTPQHSTRARSARPCAPVDCWVCSIDINIRPLLHPRRRPLLAREGPITCSVEIGQHASATRSLALPRAHEAISDRLPASRSGKPHAQDPAAITGEPSDGIGEFSVSPSPAARPPSLPVRPRRSRPPASLPPPVSLPDPASHGAGDALHLR